MTAGGRKYFTSAYINIRVLRDTLKCKLPIEVFYAGPEEMPDSAIEFMESTFENVKFVDIYQVAGGPSPDKVSMKGYQIKVFSMIYSSNQRSPALCAARLGSGLN